MPLEFALAPMAHQFRQRNAHRADLFAAPQNVDALGRWPAFHARQAGVSTEPIGPGINPAIGVAADGADRPGNGSCRRRSGYSAASRANRSAEHRRPAVVDHDDVVFRRPVEIARRGADRSRTSCRPRFPARSPTAPALSTDCRPSSSVGTIFSILARTMWTFGSVWVRSPLPSLVTMTAAPGGSSLRAAAWHSRPLS